MSLSSVMIPGECGPLEGKYHASANQNKYGKSVAIILHPDPKHGGTMNNKVVKSMFDAFALLDFDVIRFNFRGVGKSKGEYSGGEGELNDALMCIDWMINRCENLCNAWIGGFAFGGLTAIKAVMRRPEISGFVAVNPLQESQDLNMLTPCPNGLLIAGKKDHVVDHEMVCKLSTSLSCQKNAHIKYECLETGDHYMSNCLEEVNESIYLYVKEHMHNPSAPSLVHRKKRRINQVK